MGSTVTTGRAAAAIETQQGRKLFVLFEETYESNVSPKIPSWCCVGLGYLPETLRRIFEMASSCEGGMLRNRSGRLTPEGYIGTWLKQLANPLILHQTGIQVRAGDGLYDAVPTARLDEAVDLLAHMERPNQADDLHDRASVTLDVMRDTDAILALQTALSISPWRLIGRHAVSHRDGKRNSYLGFDPPPGRAPKLDSLSALKLNQNVRLIQDGEGVWRCGGWEYVMVGNYVRELWRAELESPGHHYKRIAEFRDALQNAPQAPEGLTVEISGAGVEEAYYRERIEALRLQAGGGDPFHVTVTPENEYDLTNLPRACARWLVPDRPASTQAHAMLAI